MSYETYTSDMVNQMLTNLITGPEPTYPTTSIQPPIQLQRASSQLNQFGLYNNQLPERNQLKGGNNQVMRPPANLALELQSMRDDLKAFEMTQTQKMKELEQRYGLTDIEKEKMKKERDQLKEENSSLKQELERERAASKREYSELMRQLKDFQECVGPKIDDLEKELKEEKRRNKELQETLEAEEQIQKELREEIQVLEEKNQEIEAMTKKKFESKIQELQKSQKELTSENIQMKKGFKSEKFTLEKALEKKNGEIQNLNNQNKRDKEEWEECDQKWQKALGDITERYKELLQTSLTDVHERAMMQEKISKLEDRITKLSKDNVKWKKQSCDVQMELAHKQKKEMMDSMRNMANNLPQDLPQNE